MPTYAIGDVQGCFDALQRLLDKIQFDPLKDSLWFTGDLVNRGSQSLEVLRFIKQLGRNHHTVLGNHDLHLLAVAHGAQVSTQEDTFESILTAPDRDELIHWLCHQPLLYQDKLFNFVMVHAGLASCWKLDDAKKFANEIENILVSDARVEFFKNLYGNYPNQWQENLAGWDRLRCITNYFTRVRFCHEDGSMELSFKGKMAEKPDNLVPWFQVPERATQNLNIIFGHWAALEGVTHTRDVFALDTGCVWGYCLTAMRLEDEQRFSVKCK